MADGNPVNPQITDAITQTNVKVLGEAPAMAPESVPQASASAEQISAPAGEPLLQGEPENESAEVVAAS